MTSGVGIYYAWPSRRYWIFDALIMTEQIGSFVLGKHFAIMMAVCQYCFSNLISFQNPDKNTHILVILNEKDKQEMWRRSTDKAIGSSDLVWLDTGGHVLSKTVFQERKIFKDIGIHYCNRNLRIYNIWMYPATFPYHAKSQKHTWHEYKCQKQF